MFPLGTHPAVAIDAVLGMSGTGKEQVGVLFEATDGSGERITWYGYFTDATFDRTIESLRYMGWTGNDLLDFHKGLPPECKNEVYIVVEDEPDQNGTPRRRVKWVNSARGVAVKQVLDDAQARAFGARMKAKVAALRAKDGAPRPAPRPAPVGASVPADQPHPDDPGVSDDDIPF